MQGDGPRDLMILSEVTRQLAVCRDIDEVLNIRDRAEALRQYAKKVGMTHENQNALAEIKVRTERRAGELLAEMEKHEGGRPNKTGCKVQQVSLQEMGIERTQSHRWQRIASIPEKKFESQLSALRADNQKEITSAAMLKLAKAIKARQPKPNPAVAMEGVYGSLGDLPAGSRFATVYADPPWQYENQGTRAATDNHYETMTVDELCKMSVSRYVSEDAHLHLWTTNAFLFDAKRVMEAWGFEYKSCFVWVKTQMGIGNYWRVSHEFLFLGVRGKCPFENKGLKSWGEYKRTKHSAKPDAVRGLIEQASLGPYLELFGRRQAKGWVVVGNQVDPQKSVA